jgi:hypothetical protein
MANVWWDFIRDNTLNAAARNVILKYRVDPCFPLSTVCSTVNCWGFHHPIEMRRSPIDMITGVLIYNDTLCQQESICPWEINCQSAHNFSELNYHPYSYKTRMCINSDGCPLAHLCAYAHSEWELRICGMPRVSYSSSPCDQMSWSDSDRLFFIICWVQLVDTNLVDLAKIRAIHSHLLSMHSPESLLANGAAISLQRLLRRTSSGRASPVSTATSTLDL